MKSMMWDLVAINHILDRLGLKRLPISEGFVRHFCYVVRLPLNTVTMMILSPIRSFNLIHLVDAHIYCSLPFGVSSVKKINTFLQRTPTFSFQ